MKKNLCLLAFMLGLTVTLGGAAVFKRLGLPLPISGVIQAQAAGLAPSASAAYSLDWFVLMDGGGGTTGGGSFTLVSTLAQADASDSAAGSYALQGGFLPGTLQPWTSYIPLTRH